MEDINNRRRNQLKLAINKLDEANEIVSQILDDENEELDNVPENLSGAYWVERKEEVIDELSDAVSSIEGAITSLDGASC